MFKAAVAGLTRVAWNRGKVAQVEKIEGEDLGRHLAAGGCVAQNHQCSHCPLSVSVSFVHGPGLGVVKEAML